MVLLLVGAALAGAILWLGTHPPGSGTWYPPCVFRKLTGLYCPGCGSTRSSFLFTQGEFLRGVQMNPFFALAVPFVVLGASSAALSWCTHGRRRLIHVRLPAWILRTMVLSIVAFWFLRNLPMAPFDALAPIPLVLEEGGR